MAKNQKNFYAVRKGVCPGIYKSWEECQRNVTGFSGAEFKGFKTLEEAEEYMGSSAATGAGENAVRESAAGSVSSTEARSAAGSMSSTAARSAAGRSACGVNASAALKAGANGEKEASDECFAFVDGSFNAVTKVYGYGGFLVDGGQKHILQGAGSDPEMAEMRNVAGEICGCVAAVEKAIELGIKEIKIYYDYMGIEMWATGKWKRNKTGTAEYHDFMQKAAGLVNVRFVKVKGHSGVEGNEEADRLAKEAVGI